MPVKCWAAELGGCGPQSKEHLISRSLFADTTVRVEGFPWCLEPVELSLESISAKILCIPHNNELSPVDATAKHVFDDLEESERISNQREAENPERWTVRRYRWDGRKLERWFLKTLINLCVAQPSAGSVWGPGRAPIAAPPLHLVRAAFGLERLGPRLGLYMAAEVGEQAPHGSRLEFAPLLASASPGGAADELAGAIFTMRWARFVVSIADGGLQEFLRLPTLAPPWNYSRVMHHLKRIKMKRGRTLSQVVDLRW